MVSPRLLRLVNVYQALAAAALLAMSLVVWPAAIAPGRGLGVFAGSVVMGVNLWTLRLLMGKLAASSELRGLYAVGLLIKFFTLFGVMFVLLVVAKLDPAGMMLGLCTLFAGVAGGMGHVAAFKGGATPAHAAQA